MAPAAITPHRIPTGGTAYGLTYPRRVPTDQRPSVRSSPVRARIEHLSDPLLQRIARLPRALPVVIVLALIVLGAILWHPWGAVCFGLCALLAAWLLYLTWPRLGPTERMMRIAALLIVVALTVVTAGG